MYSRVKSLLALAVFASLSFTSVVTADEIVRTGEGRNFYNNFYQVQFFLKYQHIG